MAPDTKDLYVQLFERTHSLVALYKPADKKFIQVNKFGLNMFELRDTDDFIARFECMQLWPDPPHSLSAYLAEVSSAIHIEGFMEQERLYQTANGKKFWGLLRIDSLEVLAEIHLLITITNIDLLKNTALAAARDAQRLHAIFDNSTVGIIITDTEGKITDFNNHAEQQFGYTRTELIGKPIEFLIPTSFRENHKKYRASFVQHPRDRVMGAGRDLYARKKGNHDFPVEVSLSHYQAGEERYIVAFVVDITVRKSSELVMLRHKEELERYAAQVKELNAELEKKVEDRTKMLKETLNELEQSREELRLALEKEMELGEMKSRFVTIASHEFRTPLSTILSSAYIVQQYTGIEDQDKRESHLLKIQNAVQNLTFILDEFLSLEKLENGAIQVQPEVLTDQDLIINLKSVAEDLNTIMKNGQYFEFTSEPLPPLRVDKKLLRNILVNIYSNAVKYSPEYSIIKVDITSNGNHIKIAITDQGMGIPPSDQKHLFERFFRASNSAAIQGTGMGLHIVGRYLQLLGGSIELKSELGRGTTFTIVLPAGDNT